MSRIALGGIWIEALKDTRVRLRPVTPYAALGFGGGVLAPHVKRDWKAGTA